MSAIRQTSETGQLLAAGYEWAELYPPTRLLMWVSVAGGFFLFAVYNVDQNVQIARLSFVGALALWFAALMIYLFWLYRSRSLIFTIEGAMLTPHGLPGLWRRFEIEGNHSEITSIELMLDEENSDETNKNYRVAVYSQFGNIIRVSAPLHHDDAYRVQTQLKTALKDMREAIQKAKAFQSDGRGGSAPRPSGRAVIPGLPDLPDPR